MKFGNALTLVLVSTVLICTAVPAHANEKDRKNRREAIAAGAVREAVVKEKADNRYAECMKNADGSDDERRCKRDLRDAEREANRKGRRTAIVVGAD